MQTIQLKDSQFRVIGHVQIKDNGDKVLQDKDFITLGFYDAKNDLTKDKQFRVVGHGDILTSLLK
jgi:sugar phosphate isomerase/epimerase